jgi:hypothetical protein
MNLWQLRVVISGAVGVLSMMASDQPAPVRARLMEPTMMRVPYPDEMYAPPGGAPEAPYASCYRVGRCSAYDLYRFRDRPNWLTRLAPEAPSDSDAWQADPYMWVFVPVTPEENIRPKYRTASQVRDEHRAVSRPIDGPY